MLNKWNFNAPTNLIFGEGATSTIGDILKNNMVEKIFISTDKGVVEAGIVGKMVDSLEKSKIRYEIFDEVEANPSVETVEKAFALFEKTKCSATLGIGGGSSIDVAKLVAVLGNNPGPIIQYEGPDKYPNPALPIYAVPTTAGTGAEVTGSAVVTDHNSKIKRSVRSKWSVPKAAILDPTLLVTLPPHIAAATGMDALAHAIEGYLSTWAFPLSEALSLYAIELIGTNIRKFVANRNNIEAASNMLLGSTVAALAFTYSRTGTPHAMAHPMGGHFNIPHGTACALALQVVMEYSWIGNPEKFARVAKALGEKTEGLDVNEAALRAVEAVKKLNQDVGITQRLSDFGVTVDALSAMAHDAVNSGIHLSNPRTTNKDEITYLYKQLL